MASKVGTGSGGQHCYSTGIIRRGLEGSHYDPRRDYSAAITPGA